MAAPPRNPEPAIRFGLSTKFALWVVALVLVVAGGISVFVLTDQRAALREQITARGRAVARNLSTNVAAPLLQGDKAELGRLTKSAAADGDVEYVAVIDDKGIVQGHSDLSQVGQPYRPIPGTQPLGGEPERVQTVVGAGHRRIIDVGMPVRYANAAGIGELHLGISEESITRTVQAQLVKILLVSLVALGLGIIGAIVLARFIVWPVRVLTQGAEKIGAGNLTHRIEVSTRDELGQLAHSFNDMTTRLKVAQDELLEKQRMEEELRIAQEIQESLLPTSFPEVKGYDIHAMYHAAKEVGGDYFDFIPVAENQLGLAVADVSGKGVPGSLGMTVTRTILRAQAPGQGDAAAVLTKVNRLIWSDIKRGMFVSVMYVILDGPRKTAHVASAGHNPMFLYRAARKEVEALCPPGLALGLDPGPIFERRVRGVEVALQPGDLMVMYTDGVTEAMNNKQQEFGEDALVKVLQRVEGLTAQQVIRRISEAVNRFVGDTPQSDDITVLAVRAL